MPGISLIMAICEGSSVFSHGIAYMVANCHKFPDSRLLAHLSLQVANCQGVICMNICLCTVCTLPGPPGLVARQRSFKECLLCRLAPSVWRRGRWAAGTTGSRRTASVPSTVSPAAPQHSQPRSGKNTQQYCVVSVGTRNRDK